MLNDIKNLKAAFATDDFAFVEFEAKNDVLRARTAWRLLDRWCEAQGAQPLKAAEPVAAPAIAAVEQAAPAKGNIIFNRLFTAGVRQVA